MPAKSPKEAVDVLVDRLRAINGCVCPQPLHAAGFRPAGRAQSVSFLPLGASVPLGTLAGTRGVLLHIKHDFETAQADARRPVFEVRSTGRAYRILNHANQEILAHHWHPAGVSPVTTPHLHLSSQIAPLEIGLGANPVALAAMHLPTGHIHLDDIVRLLISEFDIAPLRDDWQTILQPRAGDPPPNQPAT